MSVFRSSQYYFARCENEKTNFWLSHVIDQSWEGFRVEYTKLLMWTLIQCFQGNLEANSTTGHHILNFKISISRYSFSLDNNMQPRITIIILLILLLLLYVNYLFHFVISYSLYAFLFRYF